jgi:hypothetical protein
MASSTQDLADLIATPRSRHARALQSDLLKLRATHGCRAVDEAFQLCRRAEAREALSISGARAKERTDRQDERLAKAIFQRRERS